MLTCLESWSYTLVLIRLRARTPLAPDSTASMKCFPLLRLASGMMASSGTPRRSPMESMVKLSASLSMKTILWVSSRARVMVPLGSQRCSLVSMRGTPQRGHVRMGVAPVLRSISALRRHEIITRLEYLFLVIVEGRDVVAVVEPDEFLVLRGDVLEYVLGVAGRDHVVLPGREDPHRAGY